MLIEIVTERSRHAFDSDKVASAWLPTEPSAPGWIVVGPECIQFFAGEARGIEDLTAALEARSKGAPNDFVRSKAKHRIAFVDMERFCYATTAGQAGVGFIRGGELPVCDGHLMSAIARSGWIFVGLPGLRSGRSLFFPDAITAGAMRGLGHVKISFLGDLKGRIFDCSDEDGRAFIRELGSLSEAGFVSDRPGAAYFADPAAIDAAAIFSDGKTSIARCLTVSGDLRSTVLADGGIRSPAKRFAAKLEAAGLVRLVDGNAPIFISPHDISSIEIRPRSVFDHRLDRHTSHILVIRQFNGNPRAGRLCAYLTPDEAADTAATLGKLKPLLRTVKEKDGLLFERRAKPLFLGAISTFPKKHLAGRKQANKDAVSFLADGSLLEIEPRTIQAILVAKSGRRVKILAAGHGADLAINGPAALRGLVKAFKASSDRVQELALKEGSLVFLPGSIGAVEADATSVSLRGWNGGLVSFFDGGEPGYGAIVDAFRNHAEAAG